MSNLILYHGDQSVCSIKVRIALAEMGLSWKSQVLDIRNGEQFTDWYQALNPNSVVPTLRHGDMIVRESSVIIDYLDKLHDKERFMPKALERQTLTMLWLVRTIEIHNAINSVTFATRMRDLFRSYDPEKQKRLLEQIPNPLVRQKRVDIYSNGLDSNHVVSAARVLNQLVSDMDGQFSKFGGPWLMGQIYSLADIALYAYFDRLARLNMSGFWNDRFPRVGEWLERGRARPSYESAVVKWVGELETNPDTENRIWLKLAEYIQFRPGLSDAGSGQAFKRRS